MSDAPSFFEAVAQTPLLQRALAAGALVGLACACLSPFVILKRMAFVGDGMAHAAFGGLGLGLYLLAGSQSDDLGVQGLTIAYCLVLAVAVGRVSRRGGPGRIAEDSAIGVAFAVSMALGALLITLRQRRDLQYTSWEGYLFGSLLSVGRDQVWMTLVLAVAVIVTLWLFHKELMFYTYDEGLAEISGLPITLLHYLFLLLLVLTVVISARILGIVLVSASLVIPGLVALALCRRLAAATIVAGAIGVLTFELGLYLSYTWSIPPGSAVILLQFAVLLGAQAVQGLRRE